MTLQLILKKEDEMEWPVLIWCRQELAVELYEGSVQFHVRRDTGLY
jgi:hypothetical protein